MKVPLTDQQKLFKSNEIKYTLYVIFGWKVISKKVIYVLLFLLFQIFYIIKKSTKLNISHVVVE